MARIEQIFNKFPRTEWINEFNKLDNITINESKGYIIDNEDDWTYRMLPNQLDPNMKFRFEEGDIILNTESNELYLLIYYPPLDSRSNEFNPCWVMETGNTYIGINITTIIDADICIYSEDNKYVLANSDNRISDKIKEYQTLIRNKDYDKFYEMYLKDNNFKDIIRIYI